MLLRKGIKNEHRKGFQFEGMPGADRYFYGGLIGIFLAVLNNRHLDSFDNIGFGLKAEI